VGSGDGQRISGAEEEQLHEVLTSEGGDQLSTSILNSTKKILGVTADDPVFDLDIITHINSAFSTLCQLGVGPANGFMIEDDSAQWDDFLGDDRRFNSVRSYVYLKVRMLFDPPTTSYLLDAMRKQIEEFEFRLQVDAETPSTGGPTTPNVVVDGGAP
jgi:hypothetical protein